MSLLRKLRVAVVGLGGTGSVVARLLAGAGVERLYCIDGDIIATHDAPRLWYYSAGTEGQGKATVARREILRAFPDLRVKAIQENFPRRAATTALSAA
jgi:molybdopterin/thiamine biosynthesis adenylyltransferase